MPQLLRRYFALPREVRSAYWTLAASVPRMARALKRKGLRELLDRTRETTQPQSQPHDVPAFARAAARALASVQHFGPYRGACLSRSMALWAYLLEHGIESEIRIGSRITDGAYDGHAWVELDGRVLNDAADVADRYRPFDRAVGGPGSPTA